MDTAAVCGCRHAYTTTLSLGSVDNQQKTQFSPKNRCSITRSLSLRLCSAGHIGCCSSKNKQIALLGCRFRKFTSKTREPCFFLRSRYHTFGAKDFESAASLPVAIGLLKQGGDTHRQLHCYFLCRIILSGDIAGKSRAEFRCSAVSASGHTSSSKLSNLAADDSQDGNPLFSTKVEETDSNEHTLLSENSDKPTDDVFRPEYKEHSSLPYTACDADTEFDVAQLRGEVVGDNLLKKVSGINDCLPSGEIAGSVPTAWEARSQEDARDKAKAVETVQLSTSELQSAGGKHFPVIELQLDGRQGRDIWRRDEQFEKAHKLHSLAPVFLPSDGRSHMPAADVDNKAHQDRVQHGQETPSSKEYIVADRNLGYPSLPKTNFGKREDLPTMDTSSHEKTSASQEGMQGHQKAMEELTRDASMSSLTAIPADQSVEGLQVPGLRLSKFNIPSRRSSSQKGHRYQKPWSTASVQEEGGSMPRRQQYSKKSGEERPSCFEIVAREVAGAESDEELALILDSWKYELRWKDFSGLMQQDNDWKRVLALHDWMVESGGWRPSVYSYNLVIKAACRAKRWRFVEGLIAEMTAAGCPPDKYTFSTLISALGKAGKVADALQWMKRMEAAGCRPDLISLSSIIAMLGREGQLATASSLFSKLKSDGVAPDGVLYNTMISLYGKARRTEEALDVLQEMKSAGLTPDTVSYSTLISALGASNSFCMAQDVFEEMTSSSCPVDILTCNHMIDIYRNAKLPDLAEKLFLNLRRWNLTPNLVTYNSMIGTFAEAGMMEKAVSMFYQMPKVGLKRNVVSFNALFLAYKNARVPTAAMRLLKSMKQDGVEPNSTTYCTLFQLYGQTGQGLKAARMFQELREKNYPQVDKAMCHVMMGVYERAGLFGHAKRLRLQLQTPDKVDSQGGITILAKAGRVEEALRLLREHHRSGSLHGPEAYASVIAQLRKMSRFRDAVDVHLAMKSADILPNSSTLRHLLACYSQAGQVADAAQLFNEMQHAGYPLDENIYMTMMRLHSQAGQVDEAFALLGRLKGSGEVPSQKVYWTLIRMFEKEGRLEDGSKLYLEMKNARPR